MRKMNRIKLALDALMLVVLLLMYRRDVLGLTFHEVGGIAVCGLFIIHILLNGRWTLVVTGKLFSAKTAWRNKLNWLVDFLLLLCFAYILISGILISKILFIGIRGESIFKTGHFAVSALALLLLGVHLGLHYNSVLTRTPARKLPLTLRRVAAVVMSAVILGFGTYELTATSFTSWLGGLGATIGIGEPVPESDREERDPALTDGDAHLLEGETEEVHSDALSPEGETEEVHGGGTGRGGGKGKNADLGGFYPELVPEILFGFLSITLIAAVIVAWIEGIQRAVKRKKYQQTAGAA